MKNPTAFIKTAMYHELKKTTNKISLSLHSLLARSLRGELKIVFLHYGIISDINYHEKSLLSDRSTTF